VGNDFWHYLAVERLGLASTLIEQIKARFVQASAGWSDSITASFLSDVTKERYLALLAQRRKRLDLRDPASVRSCPRNRFTAGMGRSSAGGRGAVALVGDLVSAQGDKWIHPGSVVSGRPAGHQGGQTNGACGQQ